MTAPAELREQLRPLTSAVLIRTAARLRPGDDLADPTNATKYAMRELALRHQFLTDQLKRLDTALDSLVANDPSRTPSASVRRGTIAGSHTITGTACWLEAESSEDNM